MADAGYDIHKVPDFWHRLHMHILPKKYGKGQRVIYQPLLELPDNAERIRQIKQWIPEVLEKRGHYLGSKNHWIPEGFIRESTTSEDKICLKRSRRAHLSPSESVDGNL